MICETTYKKNNHLSHLDLWKIGHVLFLFAYSCYYSLLFIEYTMFSPHISVTIFSAIRVFSLILITISMIFFNRYKFYQIILFLSVLVCVLVVVFVSGSQYNILIDTYIVIFGANNVNFRKITRISCVLGTTLLIITFIASQTGIIINLVYSVNQGTLRNSFGTTYPTQFASHVFFILLAYAYLKGKRYSYWDCIICMVCSWFLMKYCNAKLSAITVLMIIPMMLYYKHRKPKKIGRVLKIVLNSSTIICAGFTILTAQLYSVGNSMLNTLNQLFTYRLMLGNIGIAQYGYKLFGQYIYMKGLGGSTTYIGKYFYIDSSYLKFILCYGVILFLVYLIGTTLFVNKQLRENNLLLPLVFTLIAISNIVGQNLLEIAFNPFILAYFATVLNPVNSPSNQARYSIFDHDKV